MAQYNRTIHAGVTVTFAAGTTDPEIAVDPTSLLPISTVTSVTRKPGEPVGVYLVQLAEPIGVFNMDPDANVWCESAAKWVSVHPQITGDVVSTLEVRGHDTAGNLTDIMFILKIFYVWMTP